MPRVRNNNSISDIHKVIEESMKNKAKIYERSPGVYTNEKTEKIANINHLAEKLIFLKRNEKESNQELDNSLNSLEKLLEKSIVKHDKKRSNPLNSICAKINRLCGKLFKNREYLDIKDTRSHLETIQGLIKQPEIRTAKDCDNNANPEAPNKQNPTKVQPINPAQPSETITPVAINPKPEPAPTTVLKPPSTPTAPVNNEVISVPTPAPTPESPQPINKEKFIKEYTPNFDEITVQNYQNSLIQLKHKSDQIKEIFGEENVDVNQMGEKKLSILLKVLEFQKKLEKIDIELEYTSQKESQLQEISQKISSLFSPKSNITAAPNSNSIPPAPSLSGKVPPPPPPPPPLPFMNSSVPAPPPPPPVSGLSQSNMSKPLNRVNKKIVENGNALFSEELKSLLLEAQQAKIEINNINENNAAKKKEAADLNKAIFTKNIGFKLNNEDYKKLLSKFIEAGKEKILDDKFDVKGATQHTNVASTKNMKKPTVRFTYTKEQYQAFNTLQEAARQINEALIKNDYLEIDSKMEKVEEARKGAAKAIISMYNKLKQNDEEKFNTTIDSHLKLLGEYLPKNEETSINRISETLIGMISGNARQEGGRKNVADFINDLLQTVEKQLQAFAEKQS